MLRMYVMEKPTKWEDYLHLAEFAYNNGYHALAKMISFEILYGKTCTTPASRDSPTDYLIVGPEMLQDMEQIVREVKKNLKVAHDHKKSYADLKMQHKYFSVEDHVYLRVNPKKSSLKLGRSIKLAPRSCRPFQILERIGPMAYKLALPEHLRIHNVFRVFLLKKYVHDFTHIIDWNVVQLEPEGKFHVEPVRILDRKEAIIWNWVIARIKVQWNKFSLEEATWELEEELRNNYPKLFPESMEEE